MQEKILKEDVMKNSYDCRFVDTKTNAEENADATEYMVGLAKKVSEIMVDAAGRGRLYAALDREAKCSTDARLRCLRERKKKAGERRKDYMALTKLDAVAADSKLRSAFEGIVARERARAEVK